MKNSTQLKVVLDACVLYPSPIRDILLSIAAEGLYEVFWSDKIQEEWLGNLLKNRSDLKEIQLKKTIEAMNLAFPDANVEDFNELMASINLPDSEDRHVVACAMKSKSEMIITFN